MPLVRAASGSFAGEKISRCGQSMKELDPVYEVLLSILELGDHGALIKGLAQSRAERRRKRERGGGEGWGHPLRGNVLGVGEAGQYGSGSHRGKSLRQVGEGDG